MNIDTIVCGPLQVNSYVLYQEGGDTAIVIDAAETQPIYAHLQQKGLSCSHILLTHGHFDHIFGVADLQKLTGAKICIHELDADMLFDDEKSLAILEALHVSPCHADMLLKDDDTVIAAGMSIRVLHTPGHTPGGVCYIFENERVIFTGDTIFRLGAGRADFPGADEIALYRSIVNKLFELPGDYTLYPGHMRNTTLAFERERNTFIRHYRGQGW